jgi:hypothetical protein
MLMLMMVIVGVNKELNLIFNWQTNKSYKKWNFENAGMKFDLLLNGFADEPRGIGVMQRTSLHGSQR